jgi:hypothetical protein
MVGSDFLDISEAHVTEGDKAAYRSPTGTRAWWSEGLARDAGVGLIVQDAFLSNFNDPTWEELWSGRAARFSLAGPEG